MHQIPSESRKNIFNISVEMEQLNGTMHSHGCEASALHSEQPHTAHQTFVQMNNFHKRNKDRSMNDRAFTPDLLIQKREENYIL